MKHLIRQCVSIALFSAGLSCTPFAAAQTFGLLEIEETFDAPDPSYELQTEVSPNATAQLMVDAQASDPALVFDGSWNVAANAQEFATGRFAPFTDLQSGVFQWDPSQTEPFAALLFELDVAVTSPDMDPSVQGIFAQLALYQRQADNSLEAYFYNELVLAGQSRSVNVVLSESDFVGGVNNTLDLSPAGGPISLGLQFGATYPDRPVAGPFSVTGTLTVDNWRVEVLGMPLFYDGFETAVPVVGTAELDDQSEPLRPEPLPTPPPVHVPDRRKIR